MLLAGSIGKYLFQKMTFLKINYIDFLNLILVNVYILFIVINIIIIKPILNIKNIIRVNKILVL